MSGSLRLRIRERLRSGIPNGLQNQSSPLDRELRVLRLDVLAAAVIRCVPKICEPGEGRAQLYGPFPWLYEVPMDCPFDGGVLGERNLLKGEQGGDRVEGGVIGPRRGGIRIAVGQGLCGPEGLSCPGPVIQDLRAHR